MFKPLNTDTKADFVIQHNNKLLKVQVKTAKKQPNGFSIKLTCAKGKLKVNSYRYTSKDVDCFATVYGNELYIIPIEDVKHLKYRVTLATTNPHHKLQAKDYKI